MSRFSAVVSKVGRSAKSSAATRRAARGGPRPGAKSRLRRMRTKRALKRGGRTFLRQMFGIDFPDAVMGDRGYGSGGGGAGGAGGKGGSGTDVTLPPKQQGKRYTKKSNVSLSTIEDHLNELVKIANRLGLSSEKQEAELVKSAASQERAGLESKLEAANDNDGSMVEGEGLSGGSISALEPEISKLITAIADLREKIEKSGSGSGSSMLDDIKNAAVTGAAVATVATPVAKAAAGTGRAAARGAEKVANKIGGKTAKAFNTAALKGGALKKKIADIAKPLVTKSLAKTALKSIPIIGAVAGLGFALGRLIKGDPVGAGLDAVSGLAGPVTAIPALVASLSRDVYHGVYGVFPEQDPLVGERMVEVKNVIEQLAKEQLGEEVELKDDKKEAPTPQDKPAPTPRMEAPSMEQTQPSAGSTSAAGGGAAGVDSGSTSAAGGDAAGADSGGAAPSPTPSGQESAPQASPAGGEGTSVPQDPSKQVPITGITPGAATPEPPPLTKSGAAIEAASGEAAAPQAAQAATGTTITSPSTLPTTRPNATGMGDVPEPSYMSAGELINTLYFGSVAGAMAA